MQKSIVLAAALTSGLLLTASVQTLSAAGAPSDLKSLANTTTGLAELVHSGGGGGHGGHMMGGGGHMGGNHVSISAGRGRSVAHNGNFRGGRWNGVGYGYGDCFGLTPYLYQQCIAGYY
jgi:hypothetical protein